ncbi:MAG: hypothetical protein ACI935_002134 [Moritella dasanensis]
MKGFTRILLAGFMALGLAACGSGGSDSSSSNSSSVASSLKSGIYGGAWTASDNSNGVFAAQLSGNKLYAASDDGTVVYLDMQLAGTSVTANGRFYYSDVATTSQGTMQGTGTLNGTDITMTLNRSDGIVNTVTFKRVAISDDASSFGVMQGAYKTQNQVIDINLTAIGALSGSDTDGCTYSGDIDIIDSSINVYALTLNISSCAAYAGDYTGFVSRDKSDGSVGAIYGNAARLLAIDLYK